MKKFFTFLFAVMATVSAFAYTAQIDGIYYNVYDGDNPHAVVTNNGDNSYTGDVVIPSSIEYGEKTYPVTSITSDAFRYCSSLTSVTLSNSIATIEYAAFESCSSLSSVTIPNSVTSIGSYAFHYCFSLTSVTIPNSVTLINDGTFCYCSSLTSVTIPNSVSSIGERAFCDCPALTSVTIPNSVTSIGSYAFGNCSSLSTVIVDRDTPATLGNYVFTKNNPLSILVDDEALFRSQWTAYADYIYLNPKWYAKKQTVVTITAHPSKSALHQALGLDSLQKVANLKINGSINSYDIMMLRNQMPALRGLDLSDADIVANAYEYADGYCSKDNTLTTQAFTGTGTRIVKLVLPKTLTTIEAGALNGYVFELTIQEGITAIPDNAFENCTHLEAVSLPESLETIGASAFRGAGLKELVLPANVHSIGSYAFAGEGHEEWWDPYSYYPGSTSNSTSDWDLHCRYDGQLQKVVIPAHSRLTEIAEGTFARNKQLKDLSILGDSIAYIDWGAFAGCGMDTLVLPPHLTALSTLSFGYCDKLKYIAMPNSLTEIADNAFMGCQNLDNVQFPVKLTSIGHHAFADCTHLRNVDIPGLVTEIGDYAFKDCQVKSVYSYLFDPFTIGQNTFSPYANANATLYIPNVEDTEMKYLYDTQWSQFLSRVRMDKNFEYKDFYANGDVVIGDNDDPLNGDPNANLEPGSGLIVEEGENGQHLGTVTITGEPGDWASLIAGCNLHVDSLRLVIKVKKNCWHFHGFPFDIPLENLHADGKYVIYEYDGQTRAERDTTGWKRLPKEQKHLKRGHGYIFNFNASGSLVITIATPNFCNMLEKIMLFFYPAAKNNNKSWNYAANPFFAYYSLNDLNFTGPVTFWDAVNRTYRSYRPGDDDYYLSPYEGFFLQNEKDEEFELTFDKTKTKTKNQKEEAQANGHRMSAKQSSDNSRAIINLTLSGEDCSDDTRVVINPAARLTYDLGMDAQKFFSTDNVPQIYSLDADQLPCAINERPIGDGVINLGLKLPAAGQYTIDATRMDQTLYLLDREKNTLHTFADGAYTFSAPAGTLPARFALVEHYEAPTGIDNTADGRIEQTATGLYIHGTADIQIYSMTGIELCNGTCSGAIELPTGVYTMVCNGQASKVVIK